MIVELQYGHAEVADYTELIEAFPPAQFKSPRRSTVPQLALWKDWNLQKNFFRLLQIPLPETITLCFEYEVPVQGVTAKGKPSFTDLMVIGDSLVVSVEAKHREPPYESVRAWLRDPPTPNRIAVLQGWLDLINGTNGSNLSIDAVMDITYQTIHRTASACLPHKNRTDVKRLMVYQWFVDADEDGKNYREQLTALKHLMGNDAIQLALMTCRMILDKSPAYQSLVRQWDGSRRKGDLDFSKEVKAGLNRDGFISFAEPEIWRP